MDETPAPSSDERDKSKAGDWGCVPTVGGVLLIFFILAMLCDVALGPIGPGNGGIHSEWVQRSHALGLALYSYANDNSQQYPDGASSTEAFQKLLDGGYVSDPIFFYVPMRGKVAPEPGQKKLKPENVCFDLTEGASAQDSPQLPLLFLTGFRVIYAPGSEARPLGADFPVYEVTHHFLFFAWNGPPTNDLHMPGLAVFYVGNNAVWIQAQGEVIPNFVPTDFDAHGKTYRQLTPDGVLR